VAIEEENLKDYNRSIETTRGKGIEGGVISMVENPISYKGC
jgi:hypothetical protein